MITPWEVIKYSPLKKDFSPDIISHIIPTQVELLADCLGLEFFEILGCDLYKLPDEEFVDYYEKTWTAGSKVVFYGTPFEALEDTNKTPGAIGSETYWRPIKKFKSKLFNELWALYLRRYLAFDIAAHSLSFGTYNPTSKGLMKTSDPSVGLTAVNQNEFGISQSAWILQRDRIKTQMIAWIIKTDKALKDKDCDSPFAKVSFIDDSCTTGNCKPTSQRRGFLFRR